MNPDHIRTPFSIEQMMDCLPRRTMEEFAYNISGLFTEQNLQLTHDAFNQLNYVVSNLNNELPYQSSIHPTSFKSHHEVISPIIAPCSPEIEQLFSDHEALAYDLDHVGDPTRFSFSMPALPPSPVLQQPLLPQYSQLNPPTAIPQVHEEFKIAQQLYSPTIPIHPVHFPSTIPPTYQLGTEYPTMMPAITGIIPMIPIGPFMNPALPLMHQPLPSVFMPSMVQPTLTPIQQATLTTMQAYMKPIPQPIVQTTLQQSVPIQQTRSPDSCASIQPVECGSLTPLIARRIRDWKLNRTAYTDITPCPLPCVPPAQVIATHQFHNALELIQQQIPQQAQQLPRYAQQTQQTQQTNQEVQNAQEIELDFDLPASPEQLVPEQPQEIQPTRQKSLQSRRVKKEKSTRSDDIVEDSFKFDSETDQIRKYVETSAAQVIEKCPTPAAQVIEKCPPKNRSPAKRHTTREVTSKSDCGRPKRKITKTLRFESDDDYEEESEFENDANSSDDAFEDIAPPRKRRTPSRKCPRKRMKISDDEDDDLSSHSSPIGCDCQICKVGLPTSCRKELTSPDILILTFACLRQQLRKKILNLQNEILPFIERHGDSFVQSYGHKNSWRKRISAALANQKLFQCVKPEKDLWTLCIEGDPWQTTVATVPSSPSSAPSSDIESDSEDFATEMVTHLNTINGQLAGMKEKRDRLKQEVKGLRYRPEINECLTSLKDMMNSWTEFSCTNETEFFEGMFTSINQMLNKLPQQS